MCLLTVCAAPTEASTRDCQSGLSSRNAAISRIVDGDTVVLKSQQHVRLIGLDTREMNSPDKQDRLWAEKAAEALTSMLSNRQVTLRSEAERKDRHGRLLAHVQLADGSDAAEQLIRLGLGIAVAVGKNTACADDNVTVERKARSLNRGLWKTKGPWWSDHQATLPSARGFYLIRSSVTRITQRGTKIRAYLDNGLTINTGRTWPLNRGRTEKLLMGLKEQSIEVRGWFAGKRNSPVLTLHHPANLQIVR